MPSRRRVLASVAAAALAGCTQQRQSGSTTTSDTTRATASTTTSSTTTTDATTETTETTTLATTVDRDPPDHPITTGLADEPTLGPNPWDAEAAIVEFTDPSCPYCRSFARDTLPALKSQYVDANRLSYVCRTVPIVADWGTPAVHGLEATYARDEAAFWDLKEFLFEERPAKYTVGEIGDYLARYTDVEDVEAIERAAEERTQTEAVSEDERVMDEVGISSVPGFVLVREGEVLGTTSGDHSLQTFERVLDLA